MAPSSPGMVGSGNAAGNGVGMPRVAGVFASLVRGKGDLYYARVWLTAKMGESFVKLREEPSGVVEFFTKDTDSTDEVWVKINGEWVSSHQDHGTFVRAYTITKVEYETDLAFELWPKLKYTSRPIRSWFKKHRKKLITWNMLFAGFVGLPMMATSSIFALASGDFWSRMTVATFLYVLISVIAGIMVDRRTS